MPCLWSSTSLLWNCFFQLLKIIVNKKKPAIRIQAFSKLKRILLITLRINYPSCTRFPTHRINSSFFRHIKWKTSNRRFEFFLHFHRCFLRSIPMSQHETLFNLFFKFLISIRSKGMLQSEKLMFCEHFFLNFKEQSLNFFYEIFKLHEFLFHRISPKKFYLSLLQIPFSNSDSDWYSFEFPFIEFSSWGFLIIIVNLHFVREFVSSEEVRLYL